jgi:L-ascorbate metabolism protein UlaG (beta-lactamase superfamily)
MTVRHDGLTVEWLGYATTRIESDDTVVYIDPGRYGVLTGEWTPNSEPAADHHPPGRDYRPEDGDVVCLTHLHHYDPDGIERVAADDATVLAFEGINVHGTDRTDTRPVDLPYEVRDVSQDAEGIVDGVTFWTVEAYNDPDGPHTRADGTPYHPEGFGCGYLLSIDGTRVFYPGDADALDGYAELDPDVALLPIGGSFTMNRHEAAALAESMDPALVVPVHYNTFDALEADSLAFADDLDSRGVSVALDES